MLTELKNASTEVPRLIKREGTEAIRLDNNESKVYYFPMAQMLTLEARTLTADCFYNRCCLR